MSTARVDDPRELTRGEVAVTRWRLDELLAKERAHDDYLVATRLMGVRVRKLTLDDDHATDWIEGYRCSLRDFARLVVDQAAMREATT